MKSFRNFCEKCDSGLSDESIVKHSEKCSCSEKDANKTFSKEESSTGNDIKQKKSGCCCG